MSLLQMKDKPIRIAQKMVNGDIIFDERDFVIVRILTDVIRSNNFKSLVNVPDPLKSRKHFWQKNFGLAPLPIEHTNASEAFAGILGKTLDLTSSDMRLAIDQADQA